MNIFKRIVEMDRRLAEMERRGRNRRRTGTITEADHAKGQYRVQLTEGDKPFITGWIKPRPLGAGGVKFDVLLNVGEQVDVVSESGDLTDARIEMSDYSDDNPRENSAMPLHIKIGDTVLEASGGTVNFLTGAGHLK